MNNPKEMSTSTRDQETAMGRGAERITSRRGLVTGGVVAGISGLFGIAAIQGSGQETDESTPVATPDSTPQASPEATPASEDTDTEFTIVMGQPNELAFEPSELTIPANTDVTIHLPNEGMMHHDFHIRELAISTPLIEAGDSITVTINAPQPGEFEYYCDVEGHRESGMVGTLIVE